MSASDAIDVTIEDDVAVVRLDDGKANALSFEVLDALHESLDRAVTDAHSVLIVGRPGRFSAGFDLKVMQAGDKPMQDLVLAGAELLLRLYAHPQPVVAACTGHALAGGALLLLSCDTRIGTDGDFKIGLNETSIGMPLPVFAVELARDRLARSELTAATVQGRIYDPETAVNAGYLDRLVPSDELVETAHLEARRLGELRQGAVSATKSRLRGATLRHVRATLVDDVAQLSLG